MIPYGGGTSVVGISIPMPAIAHIDHQYGEMNKLIPLDRESQLARFGAGTPGPEIEAQLKARALLSGISPNPGSYQL